MRPVRRITLVAIQSKNQVKSIGICKIQAAVKHGAHSTARPITRKNKLGAHRLTLANDQSASAMNIDRSQTINRTNKFNVRHDQSPKFPAVCIAVCPNYSGSNPRKPMDCFNAGISNTNTVSLIDQTTTPNPPVVKD